MKLKIRRVGNSLGLILPRSALDAWGVGEGDHLELGASGIRPPGRSKFSHRALDELRRSIAFAVVRQFTSRQIRAQMLANLHRWKNQGAWVPAYEEWQCLAEQKDDGGLFAAMLGHDENAVRLRQSMPFVGMLPREEVRRLNAEAAA